MPISHPTVIITGASRGIGRAAALYFAEKGCRLSLICHKNQQQLEQVSRLITDMGCACLTFTADVADYEAVACVFKQTAALFGPVDILINNAGISYVGLFTDMKPVDWQRLIKTNIEGVFNCCHLAVPEMVRRQSGRIINISSVWGSVGASCEAVYSATKGAINSFTKALAKELAPSHIPVNALACGAIDTQMNQFLSEEERRMLIDEIPACRMGLPREAAELIWQIAQAPEYMTGQIITLDGGWL